MLEGIKSLAGSKSDPGECVPAPQLCLLKLMEELAFQLPLRWDTEQILS